MEQADVTKGKERVRRVLIDPLVDDGMVRVKKTVGEHDAFLAKIQSALCYMTEGGLDQVRHAVMAMAKTCSKCRRKEGWPSLQAIRSQAHAIERPPLGMSPMIRSYMRSRAGRWAWSQSPVFAVAVVRYMREVGRVPTKDSWSVIEARAQDIAARAGQRQRWISDGVASEDDHAAQKRYETFTETVRALVYPDQEVTNAA